MWQANLQDGRLNFGDLIVDDAVEGHFGREQSRPDSLSVENGFADLRVQRLLVRVQTSQLEHEFVVENTIDFSATWDMGGEQKR